MNEITLRDILQPERLTAVVDIGANPIDGTPPYKRMLADGLCTLVGFEPQPRALAELNRRKGPLERYLPYAVGNGSEQELKICTAEGMTSLLTPDAAHLALFTELPRLGQVVRKERVATRRLDDIAEIDAIDFLKIDIQGGELDVFRSGQKKLQHTIAIQTEVSFITLYEGQPPFGVIDTQLRQLGLMPHCFAELKRWPIVPSRSANSRQLLEADILYVRDVSRIENLAPEQWKHLALIAHHCYGSVDLAFHAVTAAARLGAAGTDAPQAYIDLLRRATRHNSSQ